MARIKCLQRRIYDILSNKFLILFVILFLICFVVAFHLLELYILADINHNNHCRGTCCENIGSICQPCEPIDAVYTWVNGSDPILLEQMRKYSFLEGIKGEDDLAPSRYDDKQELKYSLRSLELYAPWIRRVYVVTAGQIPWWLDVRGDRLVLISHDEIIPKKLLPTFSSPAIESFLHKIPGLSERFLYLNDDIFLGAPLHMSDLYTPTNGYEVYTAWNVPDCSQGCPWSFLGDSSCDNACDNAECDFDGGDCTGDQKNRQYEPGENVDYLGEYADNPFFDEDDEGKDNFEQYPGLDEAALEPRVLQARQFEDRDLLNRLLVKKEEVKGRKGRKIAFFNNDYNVDSQPDIGNIKLKDLTEMDAKYGHNKDAASFKDLDLAGYTGFGAKDKLRMQRTNKDLHNENQSKHVNNNLVRINKQNYVNSQEEGSLGKKNMHINTGRFGRKLNVFNIAENNVKKIDLVKVPNVKEVDLNLKKVKEKDKLKLLLAGSAVPETETYAQSDSGIDFSGNNSKSSSDMEINKLDIGRKVAVSIGRFFKKQTTKVASEEQRIKINRSKKTMRNIKNFHLKGKKAREHHLKMLTSTTPSSANNFFNNESLYNDTNFNMTMTHSNVEPSKIVKHELEKVVTKKVKSDLILKLVKASQNVELNMSNVVQKFNQNVIKTDKKIRRTRKKFNNEGILNADEKGKVKDTRKLDVYAKSLIHTNKIFNRVYGYHNRKVPAHVPFLLEKKVIEGMQTKFKEEFDITVRNKFRRSNDFQFAFSYYHYLMGETKQLTVEDIFDQFDTDKSGTWSDREVRTVLTRTRGLPLTAEAVHSLEIAAKSCEREEHKNYPTPPNERYLDSDMPTLSKSLVTDCPAMKTQLLAALALNSNSVAGRPRPAVGRAAFAMLSSNVTKAVAALDEIRRDTKMFICINDNLDPAREEENVIARMLLQELYESLLPLASKFELPLGVANRFLRASELKTWQDGRRMAWQVLIVCASFLLLLSLYHMKCCRRIMRKIKSII